jgi:alkylation response protein AidB-like acyl-CoA dehydrogenase
VNFELPEETRILKDTIREFALEKIEPIARECDEQQKLPLEVIKQLGEMGAMGAAIDPQYGGAGMTTLDYAVIVEELARVDPSIALTIAAHNSLCTDHINFFGTEEQKRKYLLPLASGRMLGAWGLTEPGSGSDAAGMLTYAEDKGDHYLVNGSKTFITNGTHAGVFVLVCITDKQAPGTHGISAMIVEPGYKGYSIAKKEDKLGMRASDTVQIALEDCRVPKENLLGKEGEGFKQSMKILDGGRISIAALGVGLAQGTLDHCLRYTQERKQFGQALAEFEATQFKLADMATQIEAARMLTYRAAWLKDQGRSTNLESAMAKYYAGEICVRISSEGVQIYGGYGFIKEFPIERYFRDSRLCTIGEGTSEIQKMVIARQLLRE